MTHSSPHEMFQHSKKVKLTGSINFSLFNGKQLACLAESRELEKKKNPIVSVTEGGGGSTLLTVQSVS